MGALLLCRSWPEEMEGIQSGSLITLVRCGQDATILLTDGLLLLACGDNRFNRLGLDQTSNVIRWALRVFRALLFRPDYV